MRGDSEEMGFAAPISRQWLLPPPPRARCFSKVARLPIVDSE